CAPPRTPAGPRARACWPSWPGRPAGTRRTRGRRTPSAG
ncbi:MAG: hypothetical protein AVDCRST_MAG41-3609, partial [uncultured Corynebacteriales bacterium]